MQKVLVDTNVALDYIADRKPFASDGELIFNEADAGSVEVWISALSFTTIYYILRPINGRNVALQALRKFRTVVRTAPVDAICMDRALASDFHDLEDAVQYEAAMDAGLEMIITRDPRGFRNAQLPVMSPEQFLKAL
jgi:predicted nucleic acid-binding protein